MNTFRKWLHKPMKDADSVMMMRRPATQQLTSRLVRKLWTRRDVTVDGETASPAPQRPDALLGPFDPGSVDVSFGQTVKMDGSDADLMVTVTRLNILRDLLQAVGEEELKSLEQQLYITQREEVSAAVQQHHCTEHLRATTTTQSPQHSAPPPDRTTVSRPALMRSEQLSEMFYQSGNMSIHLSRGPEVMAAGDIQSCDPPNPKLNHSFKPPLSCSRNSLQNPESGEVCVLSFQPGVSRAAWDPSPPAPEPSLHTREESPSSSSPLSAVKEGLKKAPSLPSVPPPPSFPSSLPSSPHPQTRRLHSSLPCSPLLGGRRWRSSSSSCPSSYPPAGLSRLWVEAALERSKNIRQHGSRTPTRERSDPAPTAGVNVEEVMKEEELRGKDVIEEEGKESMYESKNDRDEEQNGVDAKKEEFEELISVSVTWRPTPSQNAGSVYEIETEEQEGEEEEEGQGGEESEEGQEGEEGQGGEESEEEDWELFHVGATRWRYCLQTPCVCSSCPSAPPFEPHAFPVWSFHTNSELIAFTRIEAQGEDEDPSPSSGCPEIQRTERIEGDDGQMLPGQRAPNSGLYPSLSLWNITADLQAERRVKQHEEEEEEPWEKKDVQHKNSLHPRFQGNSPPTLPQQLCAWRSGDLVMAQTAEAGVERLRAADLSFILTKVFDSTTCVNVLTDDARRTVPDDSCRLCSASPHLKHHCSICAQVFCCRCLSRFLLSHIHRFSQPDGR